MLRVTCVAGFPTGATVAALDSIGIPWAAGFVVGVLLGSAWAVGFFVGLLVGTGSATGVVVALGAAADRRVANALADPPAVAALAVERVLCGVATVSATGAVSLSAFAVPTAFVGPTGRT